MGVGKSVKLDWPSLAGGVIEGMAPTDLKDDYFSALLNWYPFAGDLRRRRGITKLNESDAPADATSMCSFAPSSGLFYPILGLTDGFARYNPGGTITRIPISDGRVYSDIARRWCMLQFKDAMFAAREGEGTFKVGNQSEFHDAGIDAPATGPTLAEGAAGDLLAGNYYGVYTFYVSRTGDESNPSPASAVLAHSGSKKINWSGVLTSLVAGVDTRRLYRTPLNVTGEYYWVADIGNNIDTTFSDENVLAADMGERASWLNGTPPTDIKRITVWDERMFATDGRDIYMSQISKPQAFYEGDVIYLYRDDKQAIVEIRAFGDRLMVWKTDSTRCLIGAGGEYSAVTLSDRHGCAAPDSVAMAEGLVFWFSGDNFYRSDGNEVKAIGTVEIRNTIDAIPTDMYEHMHATVRPEQSLYVCSYPSSSLSIYNDKVVAYNYKTGAWSHIEHTSPSAAPMFLTRDMWDDGTYHNFAIFPGSKSLYKWWDETTHTDDGTNFVCSFKTGGKAVGHGLRTALINFMVMCDTVPGTITLRVYKDGETVASVSRDTATDGITLYYTDAAWKVFSLDTARSGLAGYLQIELEYTGNRDLTIYEMAANMSAYARYGRPQ